MKPETPTQPSATTRDRLMRAATTIGSREGLAAATTSAIAQEAGVAEGTLYRHFESKDDLLIATYREIKQKIFIVSAASVDTSMDPPERLKRTWRAIFEAYRADHDAFAFGQRFSESALAEREGGQAARAIGELVIQLRKDGIARGDFKKLPVDLLANLFLAPISYMLKTELKGRKWSNADLEAAAEAVLAGWRA